MSKKYPISVFIIAKNEADRIPAAIKSVIDWVDEVIVIDSGSTDDTVKVSQELGARVVYNEWKGYGPQKVYGETLCRNDWLFNVDADEIIDQTLRDSITSLFDREIDKESFSYHYAYIVRRKLVCPFESKAGPMAPSDTQVRLYNKKYAGFKDSTVHDSVVLKHSGAGTYGRLEGIMLHRCFRSFSHAVEKINFYSTMQAQDMVAKGRNPSALRILLEPLLTFLKAYFLRRYMFLGVNGFVESIIYSFARTIRLAKAREAFKQNASILASQAQ